MAGYDTIPTPVGTLFVGATRAGVVQVRFLDAPDDAAEIARHVAALAAASDEEAARGAESAEAAAQLRAYVAGERLDFDLPLAAPGTPWQRRVWAALREIPAGGTVTYGEIAARLGRPTASRAVGAATGRNPIAIVVPCHRVVGAGGALTGYAGGLHRKRWLLAHEGARLPLEAPGATSVAAR